MEVSKSPRSWKEMLRSGPVPPWLLALILVTFIVTPGMLRMEGLQNQLQNQQAVLERQVHDHQQVVECVTQYAKDMTDSLRQRDNVNTRALKDRRVAWDKIEDFLRPPPKPGPRPLIDAISRYGDAMEKVAMIRMVNPYPDVMPCLQTTEVKGSVAPR